MTMPHHATMRPIAAMGVPGVEPNVPDLTMPEFAEIDPTVLLVDETYQRNLSERSVALIRRIVAGWDWRAFKPPVCVRVFGHLHVIDGQHTAIAAATHPAIKTIPIMIVPAGNVDDRAMAFVKHNRDRIQVTATQMHYALVAAGDPDAVTVAQVCERAGARVLKVSPGAGRFRAGDTMAVSALHALVNRRYAAGARRVLEICVRARLTPIGLAALKAVEELLFGADYAGKIADEDLMSVIIATADTSERDAARFAAEHDLLFWKALAVTWFRAKGGRRGRRVAA